MKIGQVAGVPLTVAAVLISASLLSAQDQPLGDAARQARAAKSSSPHATKVVTNDDVGPGPVSETDDPAQVVNKARRAWLADMPRTCREVSTNNSGPGSSAESLREIAAPDRGHIVVTRRAGTDPGRMELIVIGKDIFSRSGTGPWRKDSADGIPTGVPALNQPPEALMSDFARGDLKLVRRDNVEGSPTFLDETKFHPGGVAFRDRTIDFWIGASDNLLRRIDTLTKETAPNAGGIQDRETITCSYGSVPEIKPPI
jgi:hypothetical protein